MHSRTRFLPLFTLKKHLSALLIIFTALFFLSEKTYAANSFDWTGTTSTAWTTLTNWKENGGTATAYPGQSGTTDIVNIGVSTSIAAFTKYPVLANSITIASLTFGNNNTPSNNTGGFMEFTVNANLVVTGAILQEHSPTGGLANTGGTGTVTNFEDFTYDEITVIIGTGTITCATFQVGDDTVGANDYTVNSTLLDIGSSGSTTAISITVTGNCIVNSASKNNGTVVTRSSRGLISLQSGTLTIDGTLELTNYNPFTAVMGQYESLSLFSLDLYDNANSPVLNLMGATPITTGSSPYAYNPIDFYNTNASGGTGTATVNYAGANQRVYAYNTTQSPDNTVDITPEVYQNITFSGSGTKTVDAGTLSVAGNFTLAAGTETVDISTNNPTVTILGNYSSASGTTLTKSSASALKITGTTTNGGTFNHTGSAAVTFTGAFSNTSTGTYNQSSTGTITCSAGLTNAGTFTQGSTGTIGTISVTGTLTNSGNFTQTTGAITTQSLTNSGNLNLGTANISISGNYINSGNYSQSTGTTIFNGSSAQSLTSSTQTLFKTVTFSGNNAVTMASGSKFAVNSTSVLTMSGTSTTLNANGALTLNSDVNGAATVAAIPTGCSISGNVTVQRYVQAYRSYRLVSSPVFTGSASSNNICTVNYLLTNAYLTGTGGTAGGFDKSGNPTLYLYRENLIPKYTTFLNSNFIGISNIATTPYGMNDATYTTANIPVGNGYLFYFRGSRKQGTLAKLTTAGAAATNDTLNAVGTLNQGNITVHDWYTPTSANLGRTTASTSASIEGVNLAGNPYASSIDWDKSDSVTTTAPIYAPHVSPFIYQLIPSGKQGSGNYNVYQAHTGGVGTDGLSNSNIIPSGEGFFVQATGSGASLNFTESAKSNTQVTGTSLNMARIPVVNNDQYLRIQLAKDSINTDNTIIRFNGNTKATFNPMEDAAYKAGTGVVSLSSLTSDNVPVAINQLPLTAKGDTIKLKVTASASGTYTLNMADIQGVPQEYSIWLKDASAKDSVNMRAISTYSFTVNTADTTTFGSNRFQLVLVQNPALVYKLINFDAQKSSNKKQVELIWATQNEDNYTQFSVERSTDNGKTFDVIGNILSNSSGSYGMTDRDPQQGNNLYRLKQTIDNGSPAISNTLNVQFTPENDITTSLSCYPNPAVNVINLIIVPKSQGNTSYDIRITNSTGLTVKFATVTALNWQDNVSSLLTGTYLVQVTDKKDNSVVGQVKFVKL